MNYRRLPLDGLHNARDLGGYPIRDGGVTAFRKFVRCEAPRNLSERDIEFLKAYGVTVSIDFRGDSEISRHPSCLQNIPGVEYCRCVTFDKQIAFASGTNAEEKRPAMDAFVDWGEKYIEIADKSGDWIKNTLREMSRAEGAVLFNCATGKDRTGLISALLLGLAGVADYDIVADYCVSEIYLKEQYEELLAGFLERWPDEKADINSPFFKTAPVNMEILLDHIYKTHNSVEGFVVSCGITDAEIARLRSKLTIAG